MALRLREFCSSSTARMFSGDVEFAEDRCFLRQVREALARPVDAWADGIRVIVVEIDVAAIGRDRPTIM